MRPGWSVAGGLLSLSPVFRRFLPVPAPSSSSLPAPILLLDLPAQHAPIQAELNAALHQTLEEAAFIQGPAVGQFAAELSAYLGGPHVVPCANGT
ncbi:MAG: DegT/DnrJ/EryC1/StrS family aminotransferase, partial [Hymenobacter sp.]|nr:DegT/DnrJ/EryC1/StrS family aminotransferase [Hymenobacter sp.]